MKGQVRIVSEVLIFAIGIGIAAFVIVQFSIMQEGVQQNSFKDQMQGILNTVTNSLQKAMNSPNSNVDFEMPETLSENSYLVSLYEYSPGGEKRFFAIVHKLGEPSTYVAKEIFNIDKQRYSLSGSVVSGSKFARISSITTGASTKIELQRR